MEEKKIFEKRWQLASSEQRARYNNLITSYPTVDWIYKEKKYLLWLFQLDIDIFETFKMTLNKINYCRKEADHIEIRFFLCDCHTKIDCTERSIAFYLQNNKWNNIPKII